MHYLNCTTQINESKLGLVIHASELFSSIFGCTKLTLFLISNITPTKQNHRTFIKVKSCPKQLSDPLLNLPKNSDLQTFFKNNKATLPIDQGHHTDYPKK